ncbi:MAG: gliding motility-associated C-terminal domain-containing protein [Bacteroidales bacterium]
MAKFILPGILFMILSSGSGMAQTSPEKPIIKYVTIDSITGETIIEWEASETPQIDSYEISTLDITTNPVTGFYLGSVPGDSLTFSYKPEKQKPYIYTVVAVDEAENRSLLSGDYHQPVHLKLQYDSCSSAMLLKWNKYVGWKNSLTGFYVYSKGETGDFRYLDRLDTNTVSFVHEPVEENRKYQYVIIAYDSRGNRSTSNTQSYFTYMPPPPDFINLDHVSVIDDQTVEISFSADISGEINDFLVSRARSREGSFTPVQMITDVNSSTIQITDNIATQVEKYFYKVEALNSCSRPVASSNPGNNIVVSGSAEGSVITLTWDPYEGFSNGVSEYTVFRKNRYNEYEVVHTLPPGINRFNDNLRQLGKTDNSGDLHYYVEAHENGTNQLGIAGTSRSNEFIVNVETRMWMPNAFTPEGYPNNYFLPVMDFLPKDYKMFIFDRTGKVLFQTTDPHKGWDGTLNGSGRAREGAYIYHVTYLSYNGVRRELTGNLTLVYP